MEDQVNENLCDPSWEVMKILTDYSMPIIEIGAGDGRWIEALQAAGVTCAGFDVYPQGEHVIEGDHVVAAKIFNKPAFKDAALLAVWPPDGASFSKWINAADWSIVFFVGQKQRLILDAALESYEEVKKVMVPGGRKGWSFLHVFKKVEDELDSGNSGT